MDFWAVFPFFTGQLGKKNQKLVLTIREPKPVFPENDMLVCLVNVWS